MRQQAIYWKNRRNDCAHSKRNIITDVHVESFWYFLKANLNQFVLPGSQSSLINEIKNHFDTNYTAEDKPFNNLISEAILIIDQSNVVSFVSRLFEMFEEERPIGLFTNERELEFIESLILADRTISRELTEKITQSEVIYLAFIEGRPSRLQHFLQYEEIIRKTWRVHLFKGSKVSLPLLASLLRFNVIPADSRIRLYLKIITKGFDINIRESDFEVLLEKGFMQQLRQSLFFEHHEMGMLLNDFEWANKNVRIALYYLKNLN